MQTQLMQPGKTDVPRFETTPPDGGQVERTPIQSVPFSIGRIDTADLQIDSGRVSREHAVVVKQGRSYRLRDLGSTNGTQVNGKAIDEVELQDGDVVVIADQEFVFVAAGAGEARRMATQVMAAAEEVDDPLEQVLALRRLQESLLHRGFRPRLRKVFDLHSGATLGYASDTWNDAQGQRHSQWLASPFSAQSSSMWNACQLHRRLAAEAFLKQAAQELFIVRVEADEVEGNTMLASQLVQLASLIGEQSLVVSLPAVVFDDAGDPLLNELKQTGCMVAYGGFVGGRAQVMQLADNAPDYLLLSPTMTRDVRGTRQRRKLAAIPEACDEIGTRAIVCGLNSPADEDDCRDLGFQLAISRRDSRRGTTSSPQLLAAAAH